MNNQVDNQRPTVKTQAAPRMNEVEYALYCYDRAIKNMIKHPDDPKYRIEFEKANAHLFEVQDAYRIALRLLLERARRLNAAAKSLIPVFWRKTR